MAVGGGLEGGGGEVCYIVKDVYLLVSVVDDIMLRTWCSGAAHIFGCEKKPIIDWKELGRMTQADGGYSVMFCRGFAGNFSYSQRASWHIQELSSLVNEQHRQM